MRFTEQQLAAIERRSGDLLLDASAGSGKTSVLVERFVRAVREDGVEVARILAITFTEKAAGELRERIRARLRELGDEEAARACEGAWISTIHGFCARVLRAHALVAGLDPAFAVLEAAEAEELALAAFDAALADAAASEAGAELIAGHGVVPLRAAVLGIYGELRSRGQLAPSLPEVPEPGQELAGAREAALAAARSAARELGAVADPGVRVQQALGALERAESVLTAGELWPGELAAVALPGRNGATALNTGSCEEYRAALDQLRSVAATGFARAARDGLDALLRAFGERYGTLKHARSAVDFEDLQLLARDLLARDEIGRRYRERFLHVMVDEMQDTNRVQLELVDLLARGRQEGERGCLFMVGDAQQSIYGFRHADVELFEERGRELEARGCRASLQMNFRTRPEILTALNGAFEVAMGERFRPLIAGRDDPPAGEPLVELLIVDKGADWDEDGLAAPWRLAEARALAARVRELVEGGVCATGDVVVLTRATTDLRAYERALEDAGVPTYVIGGRGYWGHPQIVEMLGYLRALANPLDEEALLVTLASPLCGLSLDGLVLFAAGAREELDPADAALLAAFESWFEAERRAASWTGVEELLERAIERTGYDAFVLGLPGGRRRLANVRKLMRLGREWEARSGFDLRGFLDFVARRTGSGPGGGGADSRENEAPVESEGLDAVRLMTIHRAKGLEFPVVCVADLGRGPVFRPQLIRIGRDGRRVGLRLARPGTAARVPALDYDELGREQQVADEAEARRLFYVAMTRARERLVLSGAAKADLLERERGGGGGSIPIEWIGPALSGQPGVQVTWVSEDSGSLSGHYGQKPSQSGGGGGFEPLPSEPPPPPSPQVRSISYSSLSLYERCGYRFYAERILGLPPTEEPAVISAGHAPAAAALPATERGRLVHAALQDLDLRRPVLPAGLPGEAVALADAFLASPTCARLAAATELRREQPFSFLLDGMLITGTFDALATEADGGLLVVDYKTDRLRGRGPLELTADAYAAQRLIYALAALRAGAARVEVVHLYLEAPDAPAGATFNAGDEASLEAELRARSEPLLAGRFEVTPVPQLGICGGCPAAGGLCSWPLEIVRRPAADRLF